MIHDDLRSLYLLQLTRSEKTPQIKKNALGVSPKRLFFVRWPGGPVSPPGKVCGVRWNTMPM